MEKVTPFRVLSLFALLSVCVAPFWACATDSNLNPGRLKVHASYGSSIACATASADGSICAEQDIEAEDDMDVGDDLAVGGDTTMTGALDVNGATTALGLATTFMNKLQTATATYTVTCDTGTEDAGGVILDATDNAVITLPAVAAANLGCCVTLINSGADGAAKIAFSPQAADAIYGTVPNAAADSVANGTDAHALSNTKATANKGDRVSICSDGSTGWFITGGVGIWANEIL